MRRRTARPLAGALLLLGAATLGSACNALLGNEDATATRGPGAEGGADTGRPTDAAPADGTLPDGRLPVDAEAGAPSDVRVPEDAPLSFVDGGASLLWTGPGDPLAVAADTLSVYWIDAHDVYACPLAGCSVGPMQLAGGGGSFADIRADGQYLYWTDETRNQVGFCSVSPRCSPATVISATQPHGLALDTTGMALYVTHVSSGDIWQAPIDKPLVSQSFTLLVGSLVAPRAVAVDGPGNVYWTEGADGGDVGACQLPQAIGCFPTALSTGVPGDLESDSKNVYASVPAEGRIVSIEPTSFTLADVAKGQHHPTYLALDPKYVYWVDLDGLKGCPRSMVPCSAPTLLTPLPLMPGGIAAIGGFVYGALRAIHLDGSAAPAGAIYRVAALP
jgi:hypothetical protein